MSKKRYDRSRAGTTILEFLAALVCAGMVISLATTGAGMAEKQYEEAKMIFDAKMLADRMADELAEEMRFSPDPLLEEAAILDRVVERNRYDGLSLCRLEEDRPVFIMGDSRRFVELSFGICDDTGKILTKVEGRKIRLLNP